MNQSFRTHINKKIIVLGLVMVTAFVSFLGLSPSSQIYANAQEAILPELGSENMLSAEAVPPSLSSPNLVVTIMNTAVRCTWQTGVGGNALALNYVDLIGNTPIRSGLFSSSYTDVAFATNIGSSGRYWSIPNYNEGRSLYLTTPNDGSTIQDWSQSCNYVPVIGGIEFIIAGAQMRGYASNYKIVNQTSVKTGNIPTSWDESGFIWDHNAGSNGGFIYGTIAVSDASGQNVQAVDMQVDIPLLGTKTSSTVTLYGFQFEIRTGPNKVSLRAVSSGIQASRVHFAFGTTKTPNVSS